MAHVCTFIPPHVLDRIARHQALESTEPSDAQRSAVVSAQFRRMRRFPAAGLPIGPPIPPIPTEGVAGVTVPQPNTAARLVYDDQNQWAEGIQLVRGEGDPATSLVNANRVYDQLDVVRRFYRDKLGRNSLDGQGLNIVANVNLGVQYNNAFWDPWTLQLAFGNGDNVHFNDLTGDIDVVGHEFTHGVTQFTANLDYNAYQSGALNESFSDMFGTAINAYANGVDAGEHDWLIGEDIMSLLQPGEALRNMAEPGTAYDNPIMGRDPQPRDMSGYFEPADPHLMSGITNRWFYLICMEIGLDAGIRIMYQTLQLLWPSAVFADAAAVAIAQARILAEDKQVPANAGQVVRSAARQQGFW